MFPRALRVARIRGVEVRLDPTWAVFVVLMVWSFLARYGTAGRSAVVVTAMAAAASVGFFLSLLAHELGHAFEARHRHLEVHGITLFLFGGVTEMDLHTRRPRDEFTVAAIGPYTSLVLAAAFGLVTAALDWYLPGQAIEIAVVTGTLGWLNLGLAVFNIVPGAPLDGGRVLRAALWQLTGDRVRAQLIAARAGALVAVAIWSLGAWVIVAGPGGGLITALWFGVVGLFMFHAARMERAQARTLRLLHGHTAALFATTDHPAVDADTPLDRIDVELTSTRGEDRYAVMTHDRIVGTLTSEQVADVDVADRQIRVARDVMTPVAQLPHVDHGEAVVDVLVRLHDHDVLAVARGGEVFGLVDRQRAHAALRRLQRLRAATAPTTGTRAATSTIESDT